ncbi:uncharacterized protein CTRU02_211872 [Colletotrichum truncatum]|uniref:Uncharacterized protein n=1 Tax=Colletotrichum truncatum TaxID=5467 RepID=A0ACC3YM06_COLTU|nr:uncharacterized protein CTRU02_07282 [Colletotrichum truncatum]KAF6791520.1 hypothetical protein CTRU02_07282 [Colletotrichum truncatum]
MDPLSAASGVAGLLSLGITICKGLHVYCRDYQSKDDDIRLLSQDAERLESFLQMLDIRLKSGSQIDLTLKNALDECYSACNLCMQDFKVLSTKYSRPQTIQGLKQHGKAAVRHLQYPFQKDRFDVLKAQMQEFHIALSSCLLLLNR